MNDSESIDRNDDQVPPIPTELIGLMFSDVLEHERLFAPNILDAIRKYDELLMKVIEDNGEMGLRIEIAQELAGTKSGDKQIAIFQRIQRHSKALNYSIHLQGLACFIEQNLDEYDV